MIKNVLNYEEALKNAKDYFQGDDLAGSVFISKYATTEDNMYSESTPKEMHMRMAKEYARIEEKMGGENKLSTETIFKLFNDWTIIPGGSVMNGLGNPSYIGSLSNCFVASPPQDSYSSIMNNRETLVQLMKRRGGVGIDISHLRPSGAKVNNAAKSSTGAVSFMNVYSELTKEVALCIEGTQRVLTPFGMKEIKDVIVGDFVWTRLGFIKVINTYDNGIRPVYKTKTKFGYEIETTDDHVFLTCNENGLVEKKISEFVVDEPICMLNGCNISGEEQTLTHDLYAPKIGRISNQFGTYGEMVYDNTLKTNIPTKLDKKLAYLIGYAIGDGYTNKASSKNDDGNLTLTVSCNSNDAEIINKIIKYTKDVFDVDCKPIKKNNENCVQIRIVCNEGCCFLNENGLLKPTTEFLRIPKKIFNSNTEIQMAFFSGLFDADGYASGRKKGYVLITVNENLKNDVQKLLLSNGVMSKCHIEEPKNKKWKTKYCVTIVGKYNQQKLVDLCTESIKISNLNFVSKRDCYLSPYTIKSASLLKESFIPSDGFVSVNALSRSTSYKDGILTQDYFKSLDYVGEKHVYDIELESEHLFWCEGFYVHNCGRRGALMISMSGKHPDVDEFIRVKQDLTKITGANVSVKFDDEFMNAVINDDYYIQRFPIDLDISSIDKDSLPLNQKVFDGTNCYKKVKAKEIWNEFALCSWRTAEPGIMYEDKHLNYSPDSVYEEYKGITTNPCQPSWATLLTPNGIKTMGEIKIGDVVWSSEGWTQVVNKVNSGIKDVYEYKTTAGTFYGTENHRIVSNGVKIEAKDAKSIDILAGCIDETNTNFNPHTVMDGLVIGDGSVHKASNNLIYLCIGSKDEDYFNSEVAHLIHKNRKGIKSYAYEIETNILYTELPLTHERTIPTRYFYGNKQTVLSFLRGLYSANGSVVGNRVTFKTTSEELRNQVQILLSSVGIRSYYTTNKSKETKFKNGVYKCKESFDINISTDRDIFYRNIGFIQKYKMEKLAKTLNKIKQSNKTHDIISVKFINTEEVFDITVNNSTHTYWTGGVNVSNCGEIFMDPNNSCRLMHINFANFVENPFTENAYFDYDKLAKYAGYNMRLCDDLVELELEYVTKIIEKIKSTYTDENQAELKLWETIRDKGEKSRRAGCGGTGLADAIAMLNLKFGSKESLDVINKIFHAKMWGELQMQTILAKERGAFFGFDFKKEFIENNNGYTGTNEFFTFIAKEFPEEIENIKNYGRRNVSWSTMAPVGSVSLLTQTTSGIEPLFSAFYKRRKKVSSPNDRVDFIDNTGEKFTEYFVIHKPFENWIKKYSGLCTNNQNVDLNSLTEETLTELFNKSPWGGASASELTPLQHIETQTIAQKYTTHSISKTINLPENATVDEVSQLYIDGWKQNLKGVTIYRDNCRAGVMVKSDSKCECKTTLTHNAPKRPKTMKCDIKRFKNGGEKWIAAIGLMDNKPYEIFTGLAEKLNIPEYVTEAEIIKNKINKIVEDEDTGEMVEKKVSRYDIRYIDTNGKKVTIEGLSTIFNPVFYNYSKLISGLLRHGMGVQYIVSTIKSMNFKDNNINSWKNGVIRSLKQYLEDGEIKGESCPSCGGKISRINGCKTCTNCGWSACS